MKEERMVSQTASDEYANDGANGSVSIRQMFDFFRFETYANIFFLCFYFPFGIFLLIMRLFIFLHLLLISNFMQKDSYFRCTIFRYIFYVLGLSVNIKEDLQLKNFKAQLVVCNRVSDIDPLVVNLIYPCVFLSSSTFPKYITWLFGVSKRVSPQLSEFSKYIKGCTMPVLCFPESSRTNGRVGLFKFESWPFTSDITSHLIFIERKNPIFNVSASPLGASWHANLFWLFFLPFTIFNIRYLSSVVKNESESVEEYAKRAQLEMASHTKLYASNFDNNDKKEMMKRIQAEQNLIAKRPNNPSSPKSTTPSLNEMAFKVKEVLPQVPLSVIKCDIAITKNIDDTIERILNETVPYTAEDSPKESQRDESSNFKRTTAQVNSESGKLFYCGASSFGASASDRSKSFQERKEHLFRVARMRYIQKHHMANK